MTLTRKTWRAGLPRAQVRAWAVALAGGCSLQHDGWPCGTCFQTATPDDAGDLWRALLAFRGDYEDYAAARGYFMAVGLSEGHHLYRFYAFDDLRAHLLAAMSKKETGD